MADRSKIEWTDAMLFEGVRSASRMPGERKGLDWVIVGGESGKGARPMHPDWARSIRNQCGWAIGTTTVKFLQNSFASIWRNRIDAAPSRGTAFLALFPKAFIGSVMITGILIEARSTCALRNVGCGAPSLASSAPLQVLGEFRAALSNAWSRSLAHSRSAFRANISPAIEARFINHEGFNRPHSLAAPAALFPIRAARNESPICGAFIFGAVCHG